MTTHQEAIKKLWDEAERIKLIDSNDRLAYELKIEKQKNLFLLDQYQLQDISLIDITAVEEEILQVLEALGLETDNWVFPDIITKEAANEFFTSVVKIVYILASVMTI